MFDEIDWLKASAKSALKSKLKHMKTTLLASDGVVDPKSVSRFYADLKLGGDGLTLWRAIAHFCTKHYAQLFLGEPDMDIIRDFYEVWRKKWRLIFLSFIELRLCNWNFPSG